MVAVIDVDYGKEEASTAGIFAEKADSAKSCGFIRIKTKIYNEYKSGQFYKRELPCVQAVLKRINLAFVDLVIVDGYADFGTDKTPLGKFVYERNKIPIIGIAKKQCQYCILENTEVFRGNSHNPLFVTSYGISQEEAKNIVKRMSGEYRLPYLVKLADACARGHEITIF